jgi:hypothetical protein
MTFWPRSAVALLTWAVLVVSAPAQGPHPPAIEQVRVGLPSASTDPDVGHTRHGAWAPVYVKIKVGSDPIVAGSLNLVTESEDSEGTSYRYAAPLPGAAPDDDVFAVTYVRPGGTDAHISLRTADDKIVPVQVRGNDGRMATVSRIPREFGRDSLNMGDSLFLVLGSRLPGLRRAFHQDTQEQELPENQLTDEGSQHKVSFLDNARDLPDRWFGYDAVDIVVLTTASDTFVRELLEQKTARRALGEWVRRGGKLVVSVGRNRQLVADLLEQLPLSEFDKLPLINCKIDGAVTPPKGRATLPLPVFTRWPTVGREPPPLMEIVELTRLRPNAGADADPKAERVNVLVREAPTGDDKDGVPVVVHAACGLGRVVLVGFDLDTPPFSTWTGQKAFWEKVEGELEPRPTVESRNPRAQFGLERDQGLGADLKARLESFKEVPVISFGWVALFILVYIVIVGPLDYLVLKKVFKRLELTWITFPTVVLAISVAAYFTAYSLKGNDLRINKVDVLDLDLHGPAPQAYGTTWVTLFSPRIQNYTVGVEPAWSGPAEPTATEPQIPKPVVTVMEGGDFATGRIGSQGVFGRAYNYAPDAAGLEHVSIPVWAMRTFTARWRAPVSATKPPVEAEVRHTRDRNEQGLLGRVTNNLPVELRDVTLIYRGKSYAAGSVAAGGILPIDNLKVGELGKSVAQWLTDPSTLGAGGVRTVTGPDLIRDLLFHSKPAQTAKANGGWRSLDQAWRLRELDESSSRGTPVKAFRDEVLLVARIPSQADTSENVTRADAAPTRLWLDALPGTRPERPSLSGFAVQDVYLRVYIPVQ